MLSPKNHSHLIVPIQPGYILTAAEMSQRATADHLYSVNRINISAVSTCIHFIPSPDVISLARLMKSDFLSWKFYYM